jgi:hypothetical protein
VRRVCCRVVTNVLPEKMRGVVDRQRDLIRN